MAPYIDMILKLHSCDPCSFADNMVKNKERILKRNICEHLLTLFFRHNPKQKNYGIMSIYVRGSTSNNIITSEYYVTPCMTCYIILICE